MILKYVRLLSMYVLAVSEIAEHDTVLATNIEDN